MLSTVTHEKSVESLESKNELVRWSLSDILYELVAHDNAEEKDFWK